MKKEVDFTAAHREEMRMLKESTKTIPPTRMEQHFFELMQKLAAAKESQFKRIKNEKRWNQLVDAFYPCLCELAEIQGGRVELEIDEETLFAQLVYTGDHLIIDDTFSMSLENFSAIVASSEDVFISIKDEYIQFQFFFRLFDHVQVADHSKEIAEIERKIRWHRFENRLLHKMFGGDH